MSNNNTSEPLTIDRVAGWLLQHSYELTALELHQETLENGEPPVKPLHKKFGRAYSDRDLTKLEQLSAVVVDKARKRVAGEVELRAAAAAAIDEAEVLRYELEVAREDLNATKRELEDLRAQAAERRATAAPKTEAQLQTIRDLGLPPVTRNELRSMRSLVYQFLLDQGMKMTAISFADELPGDPQVWGSASGDDEEPLPPFPILYRYFYHAGSNLEINHLKAALKEQKHAVKECASLRAELLGMQSHSDELETEVRALRGTIEGLRHKLKNASTSQLPPPPAPLPSSSPAPGDAGRAAAAAAASVLVDNPNRKYTFTPASPSPNEDELRVSAAIGRLGRFNPEDQPGVLVVADSLPHLVKGVIFARRQELIPIFLCVIRFHPDAAVRDALTRLLFNLIAKPDQIQREMIMNGCAGLAALIGRQRTEVELLPQCWEQIGAKHEERRVLVAESCGTLAQFVRPELRPSLILSILSQLLDDASHLVRQAVTRNFALLISHFGQQEVAKIPSIQEFLLRLLSDKDQSVSSATQRTFLPIFMDWADSCALLPSRYFEFLLKELAARLDRKQKAGRLYEDDLQLFQTLVDSLVVATPRFVQSLLLRAPFALASRRRVKEQRRREALAAASSAKQLPSSSAVLDEDDEDDELDSFQRAPKVVLTGTSDVWPSILSEPLLDAQLRKDLTQWLLAFDPKDHFPGDSWPYFEWVLKEYLPRIIQLCLAYPLATEGTLLIRGVTDLLYELTHQLGERFAHAFIQPMFQARFEAGPSAALAHDRSCLLPLFVAGVLPVLNQLTCMAFIKETLEKIALQEQGWQRAQIADLRLGVQLLAAKFDHYKEPLIELIRDLSTHPAVHIRAHVVRLADIIVEGASEEVILNALLPPLITLANDLDPNVRMATISPLGLIALQNPAERILEKINVQFSNLIEDKAHAVHCELVRTFEQILPDVVVKFRETCIIPKLLFFAGMNNKNKNNVQHKELTECLFAAYRALNGIVIDAQIIKRYVLPGLNALLNDAPLMESAFKTKLSAMISAMEAAVSDEPVQFPGGASTSNHRSTAGNPAALWNKFIETIDPHARPK